MIIDILRRLVDKSGKSSLTIKNGDINLYAGNQGQGIKVRVLSTLLDTDGGAGTETASNARPADAIILGLTGRVIVTIAGAGASDMSIGDGTDADRYGTAIAFAKGTTFDLSDATADPAELDATAAGGDVVLTADAGQFDSGQIRIDCHYLQLQAPQIAA